jgi:tetratricopeptide (TPR) repeat protein
MSEVFKIRPSLHVCAMLALVLQVTLANPGVAQTDLDLVRLIASGEIDEARDLFARRGPTALDWMFFDGRVAKSEGNYEDAIGLFREVLRRDPGYIAARRELAHTLLLHEDYRASAYHFKTLLRTDPDLETRRGYVHFLDEIDRQRPFSLGASLAIVTSSNVNRGSSRDKFNPGAPGRPSFDITSQAEAATGLELSVTGHHLWRLGHHNRWALDWSAALQEFKNSDHDRFSVSSRLSYSHTTAVSQWSLGPSASMSWSKENDDRLVLGFGGAFEKRLSPTRTIFFKGSAEYSDYLSSSSQDGPFYWAQLGLATSTKEGVFSMGTRVSIHRPNAAHHQYDGLSAFAQFHRSWPGGFHGGIGIELGYRGYAADFPLAGFARADEFYQITVSAQHDNLRIGGLTPTIQCLFGTTVSNIAFYDHDVAECTYSLSTRF